jgi:carbonic anhydrase/acetyltransferase-like protein (isoleucine patch superfamily)
MAIYALGDRVPQIDPTAYVHPMASVIGDVRIGPEASIWPSAVLRGDYGTITVGARTSIQDGTVIHATEDCPTQIGSDCIIGHLVHLEGCTVEDSCLVGSNSVVLHRAVIRTGALVAASAFVPNGMEVPSRAMAMGIPAKIKLDAVTDPDAMITRGAAHYVKNAKRFATELRRLD